MWDKSPELFADVVTKVAANRVKDIGTDMLTAIVERSPVDTGVFSANNRVGVGSPDNSYNPTDYSGRSGAMARGMGVINGMDSTKLQSVYFTNLTPYGKYLERGHSQRQAPNGVYLVSFLGVSMWYK